MRWLVGGKDDEKIISILDYIINNKNIKTYITN